MKRVFQNKHLIRACLFIIIVAGATSTFAQVTVDGTVSYTTTDDVATFNFSHTTGSGTNRLMLVGISWNSSTAARTISSVTFTPDGGSAIPLNSVISQKHGSNYRYSAIFSLLNPAGSTTGEVTVTFSGGTVTAGIVAGAANFAGVDQSQPLEGVIGAYSPSNNTTVTVNVTGLEGDELVFDNVFQGGNPPATLNVGSGQSQLGSWNATVANTRGAASTEQATGSSVTMSWTAASSSMWVTSAVAINPALLENYTLTAGNDGNGTVTLDPEGGIYSSGTTVTLTPVPNTGYAFNNWSGTDAGDIINTGGVYTIVMNEDKSIIANFVMPATGSATSTIIPSDDTPRIGDQITATVYIDMSGVNAPDNKLGSYTGTLNWNSSVLSYASYTGHPPTGFAGSVNTADASSGKITFNGASIDGATGNILMLTITFNVVGSGTSALDLAYSAMAATPTTRTLLPILTVTDGQVVVEGPPSCSVLAMDGTASSGTGAPATSNVSFSHTTGTGENRLLLVGVTWNCGSTDRSISSVTFSYGSGPTVLNLGSAVITYNGYSSANPRYSAIYRYVNPPAGVTGTLTVTFSGNVSNGIVAGAANFAGVDQTTPLGTAVAAGSGTTQQTTATIDVSTPNGDELVFDNLFFGYSSGQTVTVGSGQSQLWNVNNTATNFNTNGSASTEQATGTSVTMSWTATTAAYYSITAVPINPATTTNTWLGTTSNEWSDPSNWCFGVPTASTDVTITAYPVNQPVIPSTAECRNLTVNAGASLTLVAGQALTVNGNLVNNGTVTVQSDGTSTGSLIVKGNSTGNVTFNRSLNLVGFHYFSSPVELSTLPSTAYEYVEGNDTWAPTTTYVSGKGYGTSATSSLSFTGSVITGAVQISATSPYSDPFDGTVYTGRPHVGGRDPDLDGNYGGGGWNLLGNPYTSSIKVVDFLAANYSDNDNTSSFDPNYVALYLYNGTSYVFVTGDDETGWSDPNNYDDGIGQLSSAHLQAGQGFFVLAMRNDVSFNFNREMQEHNAVTPFLKSARTRERWPGLSLKIEADGSEKSTLIVFNDGMTTGLDPIYDVGQMGSGGNVNIYSALVKSNGVNFSRQALPCNGAVKNIIPVGVDYARGGTVTFSAEVEPLRNYKYWLEDRVTGKYTDLSLDSYAVILPAKTNGTGRFYIHVTAGRPDRPGNKNHGQQDLKIWVSKRNLINIQGEVSESAVCSVYDAHGRLISVRTLEDGEYNSFFLHNAGRGLYLVKVTDGTLTCTRSVMIL